LLQHKSLPLYNFIASLPKNNSSDNYTTFTKKGKVSVFFAADLLFHKINCSTAFPACLSLL